jgi:large subunit ribosomal protein L22
MQVHSIHRGAKISAFKAREVTREIQGLPVAAAIDLLNFTPKKAARFILQVLKTAIANAENNNSLRAEKLIVQEAVVGEGPTMRRFMPRARGSASPIRKRTSHIKVVVTDELESLPRRVKLKAESRLPKDKKTRAKRTRKSPAKAKAAPAPQVSETAAPEVSASESNS